jgi:hypothetical protein
MSWTLISATQSYTVRKKHISLDITVTIGEKTELMKWDKCYSILTRGAILPDISKKYTEYKNHFI